jgi:hypoxanthine phosphoribosyltransferase
MNYINITDQEHKNLVADIVRQITLSEWRPDYIVGITRGGLTAATMISHYLDIPMQTLKISLRDEEDGCESNLWMAEDAFNGKKILVVDDINDSGSTINWLMNDWPSGCHPYNDRWVYVWNNNVKFAVVVDNTASKCKLKMDYVGREITKQSQDWIVFPYESWWR